MDSTERPRPVRESSAWWSAGGRSTTALYWGVVAVLCVSLFRARSLPFQDYPQHLALASILRKIWLLDPATTAVFETNLISFNSLFHVAVAALGLVLPIELAGKLAIAGTFVLTAAAFLQLLDAVNQPRERALLAIPLLTGFSFAFGFVNFLLGLAIQLWVLARVLRVLAGEAQTRRTMATTAALACSGVYAHLLASGLVYLLMLVAIGTMTTGARRYARAFATGAPLLPAIAYGALVYFRQTRAAYQNFEYARTEGDDVFALEKVRGFLGYAAPLRADRLDQLLILAVLIVLLLGALLQDDEPRPRAPVAALCVAATLTYLVLPHVFWATNFVFERVSFLILLTAILWAPPPGAVYRGLFDATGSIVAVASALLFFVLMGAARRETEDLDRVLDLAPADRRVCGLVFNARLPSFGPRVLLHAPAYYVVRRGGEVAFSFSRTMSLPVHYRASRLPPRVPTNFELDPQTYTPNAPYARYFDLVLLNSHDERNDPRVTAFGARAASLPVLAHEGKWWLVDASKL